MSVAVELLEIPDIPARPRGNLQELLSEDASVLLASCGEDLKGGPLPRLDAGS